MQNNNEMTLEEIQKREAGILKVKENSYDTAGDHNWWKEYDVKPDEIIGVLTSIVRDGKAITPDDPQYKFYVHLWCDVYPLRFGLLKAENLARKAASKIKRTIIKNKR